MFGTCQNGLMARTQSDSPKVGPSRVRTNETSTPIQAAMLTIGRAPDDGDGDGDDRPHGGDGRDGLQQRAAEGDADVGPGREQRDEVPASSR